MELNLIKSRAMSLNGYDEANKIRIPLYIRNKFNLKLGEILTFKDINSKLLSLKIEDITEHELSLYDQNACFVTQQTLLRFKQPILTIKNKTDLTIGCDPEFFIIDNTDTIISATNFFNKNDHCGYDGFLGELRPNYSKESDEVTNNIKKLLQIATNMVKIHNPKCHLEAHSFKDGKSAGFHLHFGIPKFLLDNINRYKLVLNFLAKVLDYYITIPSIVFEESHDAYRRISAANQYGKLSDFRYKKNTFEYRSIGGVMLKTPMLTGALLSISKTIVEDALIKIEKYTDGFNKLNSLSLNIEDVLKDLYPNILSFDKIKEIYYNPNPKKALEALNYILFDLEGIVNQDQLKHICYLADEGVKDKKMMFMSFNLIKNWDLEG